MSKPTNFELTTLIKRLSILLSQSIDVSLKPYGLARTQYSVLYNLRTTGTATTKELLDRLQVEGATLSGLVDTLAAKGLVVRIEQSDDKRRKDVQLTPAGQSLVDSIPSIGNRMERLIMADANEAEITEFKHSSQQIIRNLERYLQQTEERKIKGE